MKLVQGHNIYNTLDVGLADGTITTEHDDAVIPSAILNEIWEWRMNPLVTMEDVVDHLRERTVPNGYAYCNWKQGK